MKPLPQNMATVIYTVLIVILIGVITAAALGQLNTEWAAAVSAAVPILVTLLASAQRAGVRHAPEDAARQLARKMAPQVWEDWHIEMPARGLEPRRRIAIRWRPAVGSDPAPELAVLPREGTLDQLIDQIGRNADHDKLPRLVVTGEMGAGKTAACVLIIVDLASRNACLPVMFQLGTWDPATPLRTWMTGQLPEIFPALGRTKYDREIAAALARRHILPILDGLDEAGDPAAALKRIDQELSGRPFILTCRTADFRQANQTHVLHQSLIVELQPLQPEEAGAVLLAYEPVGVYGPLADLAAELKAQPAGPAAAALRTPFMVSLAREANVPLPVFLAAAAEPDPVQQIRRHLMGTFVRKAYADDALVSPGQARRYLEFLATHTDEGGRIAWWQLHRAVPRAWFLSIALGIAGVACSALATIYFSLFDRPWLGFWIGLTAGLVGAIIVELIPQDDPRRARPRLRSVQVPAPYELLRTLGFGFMGGAALAAIAWVLYGPVRYTVIGGVLSGFAFAVARYVGQPNDPLEVVTPVSLLRADRLAVLYAWLTGAVAGALIGFYFGYSFQAGHRSALDSLAILHKPSVVLGLIGGAGGCVLSSTGLGLMTTGSSSWGRFIWTRLWLGLRGALPFRLIGFLQDAYRRGVLRQVNGYYEFRHQVLKNYLAEPSPDASADPAS